jgi:hypothetical protein
MWCSSYRDIPNLPARGQADLSLYSLEKMSFMVNEVSDKCQVSLIYSIQQYLGVGAFLVQDLVDIETPDNRLIVPSLYLVNINESGERKTSGAKPFWVPVEEYCNKLTANFEADKKNYQDDCIVWKKVRTRLLTKIAKAKADQLLGDQSEEHDVLFYQEKLEEHDSQKPKIAKSKPLQILSDTTPAGLATSVDSAGARTVVIYSTEAEEFFLNGFRSRVASLNRAFDGEGIYRSRAGEKGGKIDFRLSMNVAMQPIIAHEVFCKGSKKLKATGFSARCLFSYPEPLRGTRISGVNSALGDEYEDYQNTVRELMEVNYKQAVDHSKSRIKIAFDRDACDYFRAIAQKIENECKGPYGRFCNHPDFASKLADIILRVSAVIHLLEYGFEREVSLKTLKVAINICFFCSDEYLKIFDVPSEEEVDLFNLRRYLQSKRDMGVRYIKKSEALIYGPLRKAARLNVAVGKLSELQEINVIPEECSTTMGRKTKPCIVLDLNPGAFFNVIQNCSSSSEGI